MRPNGPGKQPAAISDAPLDLEEETLSVLARAIAHPHCDAVRHEHLSFKFHDEHWRRRRYSWQVQLCAGLILESTKKQLWPVKADRGQSAGPAKRENG